VIGTSDACNEEAHHSVSSRRWVNGAFGRAAMLFVSPLVAFPAFRFIHIEHHRHTNDNARDADHFASHGSGGSCRSASP
jgi:fatty acid desaturase